MKKLIFLLLHTDKITPVCAPQTGRVTITTKAYSLVFIILFSPFTTSAQLPFVIHMPFHGEPLFCHETACIRKAALAKKTKKNRHKRKVATRMMSRKGKVKKEEVEINPNENRMRPKFE